jgi:hypothetical protein
MKATVKGRYEGDKATAATTLAVPAAGDLRLKASATEAAFANGPSLRGLTFTLEKPGAFLVDLKPHNQVKIRLLSFHTFTMGAQAHLLHLPPPLPPSFRRMCASSS